MEMTTERLLVGCVRVHVLRIHLSVYLPALHGYWIARVLLPSSLIWAHTAFAYVLPSSLAYSVGGGICVGHIEDNVA